MNDINKTVTGKRRACLRALRIHQWTKNLLIFLPVVTSHSLLDAGVVVRACAIFAGFCVTASGAYVINDLFDLESDRSHPTKSTRPFARGDLSPAAGLIMAAVLVTSAITLTLYTLPVMSVVVLCLYFITTIVYSLFLKHKVLVDVFALSSLYSFRIVAGHVSTGIPFSPWLLAFSIFLFLSLALSKRVSELLNVRKLGEREAAPGRSYRTSDIEQLNIFGISSGFMASLVLALYINSSNVVTLYREPTLLWFLCPLILYWLCRVWLLAHRGEMNEDPTFFAVTDVQTYAVAFAAAVIMILAAHGA